LIRLGGMIAILVIRMGYYMELRGFTVGTIDGCYAFRFFR